jgi:hypothetical protein
VICGSIKTQMSDSQSFVLSYRLMRVPCYYSFSVFTCKKRAWQKRCQKGRLWALVFGRATVILSASGGVRVDWGRRRGSEGGIPEKAPILELANGFADSLTGAEKVQVPGVVQVGAEELDISLFDEV